MVCAAAARGVLTSCLVCQLNGLLLVDAYHQAGIVAASLCKLRSFKLNVFAHAFQPKVLPLMPV